MPKIVCEVCEAASGRQTRGAMPASCKAKLVDLRLRLKHKEGHESSAVLHCLLLASLLVTSCKVQRTVYFQSAVPTALFCHVQHRPTCSSAVTGLS